MNNRKEFENMSANDLKKKVEAGVKFTKEDYEKFVSSNDASYEGFIIGCINATIMVQSLLNGYGCQNEITVDIAINFANKTFYDVFKDKVEPER